MNFQVGDIAIMTYGQWAGKEVEIVEPLELRIVMILNGYRVERETYRVLMPNGEIWSCVPEFLRERQAPNELPKPKRRGCP